MGWDGSAWHQTVFSCLQLSHVIVFFHVFMFYWLFVWLCFFQWHFINLFSCMAASLFNKLTYLLTISNIFYTHCRNTVLLEIDQRTSQSQTCFRMLSKTEEQTHKLTALCDHGRKLGTCYPWWSWNRLWVVGFGMLISSVFTESD